MHCNYANLSLCARRHLLGADESCLVQLSQSKVRMMIDAEHSYFQPAINHAAVELQRRFNKDEPYIYNTWVLDVGV